MQIFGFGSKPESPALPDLPKKRVEAYPFQKIVQRAAGIVSRARLTSNEEYIHRHIPAEIFVKAQVQQIPSRVFDSNSNLQKANYGYMSLDDRKKLVKALHDSTDNTNFTDHFIVVLSGITSVEEINSLLADYPQLKVILKDVLPSET